jgi:hypothetical protein
MNDTPRDAQSLADAIEQTQAALRSCDKLLQHVAAVAAQGGSISEAQNEAAASIIKVVREKLEPELRVLEQSLTEVGGP